MRDFDDRLVVKAFFTPNLPAPYNVYERYVRDMLTEYKAASRGNVRFEFVLPYPPQAFEKRAQDSGLQPLQEWKSRVPINWRSAACLWAWSFITATKRKLFPSSKIFSSWNTRRTSKMARMAVRQRKTILFNVGGGEPAWLGDKSHVAQDLSALYDLRPVNLSTGTVAPLSADGLLIVGPARKFSEAGLWAIDQAIMHGMPAAFLVDAKAIMTNRFMAAPQDNGLGLFLQHYGFDLGHQLVLSSAQAETIGISQNIGGFVIPMQMQYPFIPVITHFDKTHPLVRGLETLTLPFVVTVDPLRPLAPGATFTSLFESSARSWLLPPNAYNISPTQVPQPKPGDSHGPYSLGGVIEGSFTSFFQGKPAPAPNMPMIGSVAHNSIVVIGTSHFVDPELPEFRGANALIANLLAWVSKDDVLLGIRSKGEILRPLKPLTDAQRQMVKKLTALAPAAASGRGPRISGVGVAVRCGAGV